MRNNKDELRVVQEAMWALWQLSNCEEARQRILSDSGFNVMEQAMRQNIQDAHLQEGACMALGNLAFDEEVRYRAAGVGLVAIVVNAMRQHPDNAALQEAAIFALFNLACSPACVDVIRDARGEEVIRTAMARHPVVAQDGEAQ